MERPILHPLSVILDPHLSSSILNPQSNPTSTGPGTGHQYVPRTSRPCFLYEIALPHLRHGFPPRPNTYFDCAGSRLKVVMRCVDRLATFASITFRAVFRIVSI